VQIEEINEIMSLREYRGASLAVTSKKPSRIKINSNKTKTSLNNSSVTVPSMDKLSNRHSAESYVYNNQSPSSIYLQSNSNYGMISGAFARQCAFARLVRCH